MPHLLWLHIFACNHNNKNVWESLWVQIPKQPKLCCAECWDALWYCLYLHCKLKRSKASLWNPATPLLPHMPSQCQPHVSAKNPFSRQPCWVFFAWTSVSSSSPTRSLLFQETSFRAYLLWGVSEFININIGFEVFNCKEPNTQLYCLPCKSHWTIA